MAQNEIELAFIEAVLDKYVEPVFSKVARTLKNQWEKVKIDLDLSFRNYLKNALEKYSKIKTILYRTEPKHIYDFFECPFLIKGNSGKIDGTNVYNLLDISHFLLIQGSGGIGKSTFLKHLFINQLSHKDLIPVFLELKEINSITGDYTITDLVFQKLSTLGSTFDREYLDYALNSGCFLFLFDGYDEINSTIKESFYKQIECFCDQYSKNYFIISSRPYSDFIEFQRFTVLSVCSLSKAQAVSLIQKIDFDIDIKNRFIESLESTLYERHTSFASNPLLLNIMLLTYDNYAEIPDKLHLFYSNAFETLYSKHDATKAGYRREIKCKLSYDDFCKVFSTFCFFTYCQGKYQFSYDELVSSFEKIKINNQSYDVTSYISDLLNNVCVLYRDGLSYKFTHRSFQEYFTARFMTTLSDTHMSSFGIQLIKKDMDKVLHDNVFGMLFDMTEERFEKNILLPLLTEVEVASVDYENKYDFYFNRIKPKIRFMPVDNNVRMVLLVPSKPDSNLEYVLLSFSKRYRAKTDANKQYEDDLLELLTKKYTFNPVNDLNYSFYSQDKEITELLKKTWVGRWIELLSHLRTSLIDKQREIQIDLSQLLSQ